MQRGFVAEAPMVSRGGSIPSAKGRTNYVMRVWGRRSQWGPGTNPLVRGSRGRSPLEADDIFFFKRLIS